MPVPAGARVAHPNFESGVVVQDPAPALVRPTLDHFVGQPITQTTLREIHTTASNILVWDNWNQTYTSTTLSTPQPQLLTSATTTSATTIAGTGDQIWTIWINGQPTATTTVAHPDRFTPTGSQTLIVERNWDHWNNEYQGLVEHRQLTAREEAERAAHMLREQQIRAAERARSDAVWKARMANEIAARERAEMLLQEFLTEEQKRELQAESHFHLRSIDKDGKERLYQIRRGRSENVYELDPKTKRTIAHFCAHPRERVPDADTMLAQKFMLENPESQEEFKRIANVWEH